MWATCPKFQLRSCDKSGRYCAVRLPFPADHIRCVRPQTIRIKQAHAPA